MRKLLLATTLLSSPCFAADLPVKAVPIKAEVYTTSPFYIFLHGGAGFTNTQNDIAIEGEATGTPKIWPAGFMVGGGLGYLTHGPISFGVEVEANYDFTKSSVGCSPVTAMVIGVDCLGSAKNSWFFAEKALAGITISQIMGYVPGSAQAKNWPIPITVPAGFEQNVMLLGVVGAAQRNVNLCAMDITGSNVCGNQWKNGLLMGAQARFAISPNVSVRVEYDYILFNQTFTKTADEGLFANTVAAKDMQRVMAGFNYNF